METVLSGSAAALVTGLVADPVFVLCNGRSGSTLLRFVLDAHPDLACPPETNVPALCAQLATVWSLIEGAPLSANRGDEPPEVPDAAIAGVRETMDRMVGSYLTRRGKKQYCDKSLGTARYAPLLQRVYPESRFICLYRHPMDVIASGREACPWGLNGYGFDPYIAATPGNEVMALANFWADNVQATLAAEERFPDACLRLRYEDLVADPEATAAAVFEFLGVPPAPGITTTCFSSDRERFGPADNKIWYTSQITDDSVGRGWTVPSVMIAPQLLGVINELCGRLGYLPVDGDWGTTEPPAELRVPVTPRTTEPGPDSAVAEGGEAGPTAGSGAADAEPPDGDDAGPDPAANGSAVRHRAEPRVIEGPMRSERVGAVLRSGLQTGSAAQYVHSQPHESETFVAAVITKGSEHPAEYWLVDLGEITVLPVGGEAQEDSDWDVIGTLEAWERVIDRQVNLSVAMRNCELRYCDSGETPPTAADARIGILSHLLGLQSWQ